MNPKRCGQKQARVRALYGEPHIPVRFPSSTSQPESPSGLAVFPFRFAPVKIG